MKNNKIITIYDEKYNYILKLTKTTFFEYNYNTESDFDFYSDFIKTVFNNIHTSINDSKYTIDIESPHSYVIGKTPISYRDIIVYNSYNEDITSDNNNRLKFHSYIFKKKFKNIKEALDSNDLKEVKKVYEEC